MIRYAIALLAVAVAATLPADARAQVKKSDSVVKITATGDKPDADGKQTVTINIAIDKSYYLYANPVGLEDLASAQPTVSITGKTKPSAVNIDYPKGKLKIDTVVGNYSIYEDKVTIKAVVTRAKGDTGPLKVAVKLQSCSDKGCLLPATVELEVP